MAARIVTLEESIGNFPFQEALFEAPRGKFQGSQSSMIEMPKAFFKGKTAKKPCKAIFYLGLYTWPCRVVFLRPFFEVILGNEKPTLATFKGYSVRLNITSKMDLTSENKNYFQGYCLT